MIGTLIRDLSHALRSLRLSPGITLTAGAALALGIGASSSLFSVVNAVLLKPLPFPEPARLVLIQEDVPRFGAFLYGVSPQDPLTFLAVPAVLAGVAAAAAWIPARRAARVDPMRSLRAGG